MNKNLFLFFCGLVVYAAFLNAQAAPRHWISASPGLRIGGSSFAWLAAELRYEFMLNPFFSVGAYVYYEASYGTGIAGRWYPASKSFFTELGFGYNKWYRYSLEFDHDADEWRNRLEDFNGIDIIPGFGWRIDFGKPGGFYISPGIKIPFLIRWYKNPYIPDPQAHSTFIGYFGLGWAF